MNDKKETVEEFLQRGGKITKLPAEDGNHPITAPKINNGQKTARRRDKRK